ncbi:DEAD/DEAH box helicase [uncultured Ruegeria sp.]|uniref:DEAD/DEAH box helicase n=1 Tax=uncultured Ruegeria sp. TaxID=259304 RepID=UPI00262D7DE3|nr:DEAD/DEAH box helicase [uncultured Ruegeria sp.]
MSGENSRGLSTTAVWQASCKDCAAEQLQLAKKKRKSLRDPELQFEYSDSFAHRTVDLGNSRSDRCERHRKAHRQAITALAVPYIDLKVIREVRDSTNPTGPLGGLGPLPIVHNREERSVDLSNFGFGMSDADVLAILDGLADKRVAVIEAGTGTGKSTFMPFRLMNSPPDAQLNLTKVGPIVVTEPRRAAATGVARFVGEELCFGHNSRDCDAHIGPGYPVGYQVSGDKNWDNACDLIYVTDGTMINWVRDGSLSRIGMVIIDEAHERSENIDIILAQLREKIHEFKHLRVVITSATIDCDFFISYFGGSEHVFHYSVPEKKNFGYGVPLFVGQEIDENTLAQGLSIGPSNDGQERKIAFPGWAEQGPEDEAGESENLREHTAELLELRCVDPMPFEDWKESIPKRDATALMPAAIAKQVTRIAKGTQWGDILAFLPTKDLIVEAVAKIQKQLAEHDLNFDVYPLLASEPKSTIDKAIAARGKGDKRKIVVSSNLAETSLTVSGVRYVVDSGLICQSTWDHELATGSLPTKTHSQSGLRQRWGRVGRDGPGWVFPLYSLEQFLSFPVDTPPSSTRINLEAFSTKLIAAGIDLESTPLPAGFTPEGASLDPDAKDNIQKFNMELKRARGNLSKMGAVDGDGHLTEFGRDLERFSGDGTHGLALMLADQLACVHEVSFALEVMANGLLYGSRDDSILQIDRKWPSAWRITAAQRHRGLAVGCEDDLELLIRVLSDWQNADDPDHWCQVWWVNRTALLAIDKTVRATLQTMSPGMKNDAWRPVDDQLAARARAVLTRALSGHQFRVAEEGVFKKVGVDDAESVTLSRSSLTLPAENFLALQRYRLAAREGEETPMPIISHTINCTQWIGLDGPAGDELGFRMAVQIVQHTRDRDGTLISKVDPLCDVRKALPIGSVVDMTLGASQKSYKPLKTSTLVSEPFACPQHSAAYGNENFEENTKDYDLWQRRDPVVPPEEAELAVLDPRINEANDAPSMKEKRLDLTSVENPSAALPTLSVEALFAEDPLESDCRILVAGYRILDDNNVVLIAETVANDFANRDPADPVGVEPWQELDLEVKGKVLDHEFEFLQLNRTDNSGRFFLPCNRGGGLYRFDRDYCERLTPGVKVTGRVVPKFADPISISLRSSAKELLEADVAARLSSFGETRPFFEASIVVEANEHGRIVVEIDLSERGGRHSHQFEVHEGMINKHPLIQPEIGQTLLVALEEDNDPRRVRLKEKLTDESLAFAEQNNSGLDVFNNSIVPAKNKPLSLSSIKRLLKIHNDESWQRSVWQFYDESLCLKVSDVRPAPKTVEISTNDKVVGLLKSRGRDVGQELGVRVKLASNNTIELSDIDPAVVDAAEHELQRLAGLKFITIDLPKGTGRFTFTQLTEIESAPKIAWIWRDGSSVTVLGETAPAVKTAVAKIASVTSRITGELIVPEGKNGILIGASGSTINPMRDATGCTAHNPGQGTRWVIEGPTRASVEAFIQLACDKVWGAEGRVVKTMEPIVIADGTKSTRPKTTKPKVAESTAKKSRPTRQPIRNAPSSSAKDTARPITIDREATKSVYQKPEVKKSSLLSRIIRLFE